jgi:hypothetical protein
VIEFVFTIDYEIYGDGTGRLKDLVYEPARRLMKLFRTWNARFVAFVEVAEFEKIEACGTDTAIDLVKKQIEEFYQDGFEIGLHLHPQWCNARYERGAWALDYGEYNLCTLPQPRIAEIVDRSLAYVRHVVNSSDFTPLSFRAGNWLFQPTQTAASVLAEKGIRIDSSVFKGGLQRNHGLDYRPAMKNGYYWAFNRDVNEPDPAGPWIEVPIYTDLVPSWRMATLKRLSMKNSSGEKSRGQGGGQRWSRLRDRLRFQYPLKLDFCRMTLSELTSMMDKIICEDQEDPEAFQPVVAIGHTKDLTDFETVDSFLSFLKLNRIAISTFPDIYPKLASSLSGAQVRRASRECNSPGAAADLNTTGFTV